MRWAGHVAGMGKMRIAFRLVVGKSEGKRSLGIPVHRYVDNIKMDLLDIDLGEMEWIGLAQERYRRKALLNWVVNFQVP
jgi:hypothetical protein